MIERKKQMLTVWLPVVICLAGVLFLNSMWQRWHEQATFSGISSLSQIILENDPEGEEMLLSALKEYQTQMESRPEGNEFLKQYGYTKGDFSGKTGERSSLLTIMVAVLISTAFLASSWSDKRRSHTRISGLTRYLEQVNTGTAGTIVQTREDEFSHLQDEIYKTVTSLYVTKETAIKAKERFAENLANIAHQLKTPITAAFLSLQLMEKEAPQKYTKPIRNQLARLNRLEESLLTLSQIDQGRLSWSIPLWMSIQC